MLGLLYRRIGVAAFAWLVCVGALGVSGAPAPYLSPTSVVADGAGKRLYVACETGDLSWRSMSKRKVVAATRSNRRVASRFRRMASGCCLGGCDNMIHEIDVPTGRACAHCRPDIRRNRWWSVGSRRSTTVTVFRAGTGRMFTRGLPAARSSARLKQYAGGRDRLDGKTLWVGTICPSCRKQ